MVLLSAVMMVLAGFRGQAGAETPADVHAEDEKIRADAKAAIYDGRFEELDKLAEEYLKKRERVRGGVWKIRHFSNGLSEPANPEDSADWDLLIENLEKWNGKSKTAFSLNALGHAQLDRAWKIRSRKSRGKDTNSGWGSSAEWLDKSEQTLLKALQQDPACVDVYKNLLHLGICKGWPEEKMNEMFDRAVKAAPEYYDIYYNMAFYKTRQWHGAEGDARRFLNCIPDLVPGNEGLAIYTRTAMQLYPYEFEGFFGEGETKVHWDQMMKGFEAIQRKYPGIYNQNKFAFYASVANDKDTARKLYMELAEKKEFVAESWGGQENIEGTRKWLGIPKSEAPAK